MERGATPRNSYLLRSYGDTETPRAPPAKRTQSREQCCCVTAARLKHSMAYAGRRRGVVAAPPPDSVKMRGLEKIADYTTTVFSKLSKQLLVMVIIYASGRLWLAGLQSESLGGAMVSAAGMYALCSIASLSHCIAVICVTLRPVDLGSRAGSLARPAY